MPFHKSAHALAVVEAVVAFPVMLAEGIFRAVEVVVAFLDAATFGFLVPVLALTVIKAVVAFSVMLAEAIGWAVEVISANLDTHTVLVPFVARIALLDTVTIEFLVAMLTLAIVEAVVALSVMLAEAIRWAVEVILANLDARTVLVPLVARVALLDTPTSEFLIAMFAFAVVEAIVALSVMLTEAILWAVEVVEALDAFPVFLHETSGALTVLERSDTHAGWFRICMMGACELVVAL